MILTLRNQSRDILDIPAHRKNEFNFVELVIILTTLLALASVLLPVIYRGSRQAKTVLCSSNLTRLYTWTNMYASSNKYFLPAYEDGWTNAIAAYGKVPVATHANPDNEFGCPSQPFVSTIEGVNAAELWRGTNYGINQHIASNLKADDGTLLPQWSQLNIRTVKDPSSKVLIADSSGSNYFGTIGFDPVVAGISLEGRTYAEAFPPTPAHPFPYHRHLDGVANFLMLDGNVESRTTWPPMMLGPGTYGYRTWHAEHTYPGSGDLAPETDEQVDETP